MSECFESLVSAVTMSDALNIHKNSNQMHCHNCAAQTNERTKRTELEIEAHTQTHTRAKLLSCSPNVQHEFTVSSHVSSILDLNARYT